MVYAVIQGYELIIHWKKTKKNQGFQYTKDDWDGTLVDAPV